MARRDLLVAGLSDQGWRSVIAGGRLTQESHSADPRLGSPGGPGGRETQVIGASTQKARLAYDIARMAFRRTASIVSRLISLKDDKWNEPAEAAELPAGGSATAESGTFAGAILQSIAPRCETPEFSLLRSLIDQEFNSLPADFGEFIDLIVNAIKTLFPSDNTFRQAIISALNGLNDDSTLNESQRERLFNELQREVMSSCYGRRDAQWALESAISRARRFIYIESPGFTSTRKDDASHPAPSYVADLIERIDHQLRSATGLHVMICVPKYPDYSAGYEQMAALETKDRQSVIQGLFTAGSVLDSRVAAFHPVGFPGRTSRLESTVVIIDDIWMLIGSSTFRRRGLTFDGGSDLVLTDTDLVMGCSPSITRFRRQLMAQRLGIAVSDDLRLLRHANFARLRDGVEAFYVIREMLLAGGLGKIERLWNGKTPGAPMLDPSGLSIDVANPDGQEFDLGSALGQVVIANLNAF